MEPRDEQKCLRMDTEIIQDLHRRTSSLCSPTSSPVERSPSPTTPILPSAPPRTILLALWPHATSKQIQYYVDGYQTLYPTAQLHLLHHSHSRENADVESSLDALTLFDEKRPLTQNESVLLHLFGNAGAVQACNLLRAYRARTDHTLDVKTVIMDNEPPTVVPSLRTTLRTPRQLIAIIYSMLMLLFRSLLALLAPWRIEYETSLIRQALNDPYLLPKDARKCYIFADRNTMFSWNNKPDNDQEYERQEFAVKRTSIGRKGRWNGDEERFWLGIESVWEG